MKSVFKGWKDKATGEFLGRDDRVFKAHEGAAVKALLSIKEAGPAVRPRLTNCPTTPEPARSRVGFGRWAGQRWRLRLPARISYPGVIITGEAEQQ